MSKQNFLTRGPVKTVGNYEGCTLKGQYLGPVEVSQGKPGVSVVVYVVQVIRDGEHVNEFGSETILPKVLPRREDVGNGVNINQETVRRLKEAAIESAKDHVDSGNVDIEDPPRVSVDIS